jgi:hypothetical protein
MKPWPLLLLLSACSELIQSPHSISAITSSVRSLNGGDAELTLMACPSNVSMKDTEAALHRLLVELVSAGLLVNADTGTARIVIDLCGAG